jgi:hypothetical protein
MMRTVVMKLYNSCGKGVISKKSGRKKEREVEKKEKAERRKKC